MKSKTFIQSTLLICVFLFTSSMYAQPQRKGVEKSSDQRFDRIEILKNRLMMDDQTYAKFKPIYAKYTEELKSVIEKTKSKLKKDNRNISALSDEELDEITFARVERNLDIAIVKSNYLKEFKKVLNSRQLHALYRIEKNNVYHRGVYANRDRGERMDLRNREGRPFKYDKKKGEFSLERRKSDRSDTTRIEKVSNVKTVDK